LEKTWKPALVIKNRFRKKTFMKAIKTVEEYLNLFPENQRDILEKIRKAIKDTAPKAEEAISYGMPGYKLNGPLVYFGGFKDHCSFFPGSYAVIKQFGKDLKDYKTSKGTIQFPLDKPVSSALIKKMVQARIKENEIKQKARSDKKTAVKKKTAKAIK
jgi:uncharacterized protein YdhG (YjbR/CyaY superfamily)